MIALSGLFLAALVAATLLPGQSEVVLLAMVLTDLHPVWLLVSVASAGNVLGSLVNWAMGRFMMRYSDHKRFPFTAEQIAKSQAWYGRWGWMSLWASWVPVIGDPLTLAAGIMREPLWRFLLVVTMAKTGRYIILVMIAQAAM
ncbi:MAG: DedA family protein [Rhodobacteraceae bacterium]|nr:MAG: DedA family protein [Paracoccaceae bacterium]